MSMHIWLRNGFPAFLIFGLWIKPPCRLSIAVLNELSFAAAYMAVGIALLGACAHMRRRHDHRTRAPTPDPAVRLRSPWWTSVTVLRRCESEAG
jgi:hypothetical protein